MIHPSAKIHPTALVADGAVIGEDVVIGPFCIIEGSVEIKARTILNSKTAVKGATVIEENKKNFVDNNVPNFDSIDGAIYMEVTNAIESLLDTVTSDKDWESAVLARTNLLNEAAKYMTEEMGRVPTKEELSEYTKIPVDEIRGIMGLSKDTQRIADTTPGHKSI